jgi:hypothetical protein
MDIHVQTLSKSSDLFCPHASSLDAGHEHSSFRGTALAKFSTEQWCHAFYMMSSEQSWSMAVDSVIKPRLMKSLEASNRFRRVICRARV